MISGIYIIYCDERPKEYYIGSAINIFPRWSSHRFNLRNNEHRCHHLQYIYNKYGNNSFKFYLLEEVKNLSKLLDREDYYLQDYFDFDDELYNECFVAGNTLGFKHSDATKRKVSLANLGKPSPRKNCKLSFEIKKKISISQKRNYILNPKRKEAIIKSNKRRWI